jgi:flagellar motor switch protein FliM
MAEILSQQEIDSLLSGIGTTNEATIETLVEEKHAEREIVRFDFRLPHRLSKRQLQTFNAVHDNFAEAFGSFLVSRLQTTVSVNVVSVDQIFYSEYILSTARPSCLYVFRIDASDAMAVMELSPPLVLAIIARMLGGTTEGKIETRTITKIEQNIIRGVVLRALSDLEKSWATIVEQKFKLERYETEGDFIQIAPTSEIVLVVSLELTIGDQKHLMNVCFPTFALEDVLAKLNVQNYSNVSRSGDRNEWTRQILKKLEATKVPAVCMLGEATLTLQQLIALEPGDVLLTNTTITGDLKVMLGGRTRAYGRPGVSNGRTAVKISQIATDSEDRE